MQLLDEILAKTHELTEQPVDVEEAEQIGRRAHQAAKVLYRFSDSCFAMIPVSDEEIDHAIAEVWRREEALDAMRDWQ